MNTRSMISAISIVVAAFYTLVTPAAADSDAPAINYISADNVYLNVGRYAGLARGARVEVVRDGKTIAVLEVVNVSSNSASCRIVEQTAAPRVGDAVSFVPEQTPRQTQPEPTAAPATPARSGLGTNAVSGYVSLGTVWQKDLTDSGITSLQPALTSRVRVRNAAGTRAEFRFRLRARYYRRERSPGQNIAKDEWATRLTELALVFDDPLADFQWGVGRLIAPDMRGVGFVDGGYVSYRIGPRLRAGAAGGLAPDPVDLAPDANRLQVGGFVAFDHESERDWRFGSAAALAGNYVSGTVSREFIYWQNRFDLQRRYYVFQSVEIDLNRDWRRDTAGERITFTNFYLVANARLWRYTTADFTYDSRKNARTWETRETPDSLFDDGVYDGYGGGVSVRLPNGISAGARAGVRYREDDRTNLFYSLRLSAVRLPWRGHTAMFRYAWTESRLTNAYRPVLSYRFPLNRQLRLTASAGGYIYKRATNSTNNWYAEGAAGYFAGRWFCNGSYRQYFGGDLDSVVLFAEVGRNL